MNGYLDFDPANRSNWDVAEDIHHSPLWIYCGNAARIFKCPADTSTVVPSSGPFARRRTPRVRSMVMNLWLGGPGTVVMPGNLRGLPGLNSSPWRIYRQLDDLSEPGPTMTALFLDGREDTINTGSFSIDMSGWPDSPNRTQWVDDLPGFYHNRAGGLSFADGHSEVKRWTDARTMPPEIKGKTRGAFTETQPDNRDLVWLQERATRKIQ